MVRVNRIVTAAAIVSAGISLVGCGAGSSNFDPTNLLDFEFFKKPPLPGERKAVFPEGVPGVPEGVPKEMVKGNQPPPLEETAIAPEAAPAPKPTQPSRRQATRPQPQPRTASAPPRPAPAARSQPASQPSGAPWPDPAPAQAAPKPVAPAWPEPNAQANWPPPDPNSFSR